MPYHVDGVPRHQPSNPFDYTEAQFDEKKRQMKELVELYPEVNTMWIEWVYDLCANTPQDEIDAMKERIDASLPRPPTINNNVDIDQTNADALPASERGCGEQLQLVH